VLLLRTALEVHPWPGRPGARTVFRVVGWRGRRSESRRPTL